MRPRPPRPCSPRIAYADAGTVASRVASSGIDGGGAVDPDGSVSSYDTAPLDGAATVGAVASSFPGATYRRYAGALVVAVRLCRRDGMDWQWSSPYGFRSRPRTAIPRPTPARPRSACCPT